MKRITLHSIALIVLLLLQQQSGVSAFTSIVGVSNIGLARYSFTPPGRSRNIHHRINNSNRHIISSTSSTSSTSLSAVAITRLPLAAALSISTFYKATPLIAGFSIGLFCRLVQFTQDVNNNTNSTNIKRRFSLSRGRSSNYAMGLCLGLVLGLVFEVLMHAGIVVPISEYRISSLRN